MAFCLRAFACLLIFRPALRTFAPPLPGSPAVKAPAPPSASIAAAPPIAPVLQPPPSTCEPVAVSGAEGGGWGFGDR